jgi:hypothetical protein
MFRVHASTRIRTDNESVCVCMLACTLTLPPSFESPPAKMNGNATLLLCFRSFLHVLTRRQYPCHSLGPPCPVCVPCPPTQLHAHRGDGTICTNMHIVPSPFCSHTRTRTRSHPHPSILLRACTFYMQKRCPGRQQHNTCAVLSFDPPLPLL